jgi:DNA-binding MarR family transcriptional regulator
VTDSSLSVLLSQTLLAFTIELDNEFELQMQKTYARPFRVSLVMWSNFMRHVRDDGTPVEEIARRTCTSVKSVASVVGGMERWGYITVDHPAAGPPPIRTGFGSARGVKRTTVIRPSMVGKLAIERWSPLVAEIEDRWRSRLGDEAESLRSVLSDIDGRSDAALPRFLPIAGALMFAEVERDGDPKEPDDELPTLLSRVLLAFALEVEDGAPVSLPLGENVLRVADGDWMPVKDLPLETGVAKEAVAMSITALAKLGLIEAGSAPNGRGKVVRRTGAGNDARSELTQRIQRCETAWEDRYGSSVVGDLRSTLRTILDRPGGNDGALSSGLVTPPGGWRAEKRYAPLTDAFVKSPRAGLARYPMVLHRGGWPDGS